MGDQVYSRRRMLGVIGAGTAALAAGGLSGCATRGGVAGGTDGSRRRIARVAHLTDLHVQPELRAQAGMTSCLHHVQSLADRPSMVVTGGDLVFDSYDQGAERARVVWDVYCSTLKHECSLRVENTLGNHDIWGWNRRESKLRGDEPLYGKQMALERLGLQRAYRSFEIGEGAGAWRGIVLDSVRPTVGYGQGDNWGYMARLEEEQFDWLARTLRDTPADRNVMVVSHVPILAICSMIPADASKPLNPNRALVHEDGARLHELFLKHPNVKLCLSGHMHENERLDYDGVTYICGGAVCAGWWKGRHKRCDEGYGVVDLFSDGTFGYTYTLYGWKAETAGA